MTLVTVTTDACPFRESPNLRNINEANKTTAEDIASRLPSRCEDPSLYYDMTGEKVLIIFNHYQYKKTRHFKFVPSTRNGTYQDVRSLKKTFRSCGFVVVTHDDWKYKDIMKYLSDMCKRDHSHTSCIAVAVMTHGKGAKVCAADRLYPVADITDMLRTAPSLVGIPKLFFIQSCRGGHTGPRGRRDEEIVIPVDADCLVLYSTYEDYLSHRNPNGSWLMQALCNVVDTHHSSMDFMRMATLINSTVSAKSSRWGKQMPVTELNLTKFLMF